MAELRSISEIVDLLRELLAELLEIGVDDITLDADLKDGLTVDSLLQLELMTLVERRLHMTFDLDAWVVPRTIGELAAYVEEQARIQT